MKRLGWIGALVFLGCSSEVTQAPADAGAADAGGGSDVIAVDTSTADVPSQDVARTDVPAPTDVPTSVDRPSPTDVPAPIDTPAPTDVPAPVDAPVPSDAAAPFDAQADVPPAPTDVPPVDVPPVDVPPAPSDVPPADVPCPTGQARCGGVCVDITTNRDHCGGCGLSCCAGNSCAASTCNPGCPAGMTACFPSTRTCGICANIQTDTANCGRCGGACAAGQVCVSGECRAPFAGIAPCTAAGDYVTASTIAFGGAVGSSYSPRCITVRRGTTVAWEGAFGSHPLSPSTRGASGNPIPVTSSGTRATALFNTTGFFPYFCSFHGDNGGGGMSGVVQVIE